MDLYTHKSSGRLYRFDCEVGIKIWFKWFYFCIYHNPNINMNFIRTKKNFYKKFYRTKQNENTIQKNKPKQEIN